MQVIKVVRKTKADRSMQVVRLPSFEEVVDDPVLYAHASRVLHLEANPGNARALIQKHGDREVWLNPPYSAHHKRNGLCIRSSLCKKTAS